MIVDKRRRVLMVAFHYAPDCTSSGVLRTLKFSKYLPDYGWDPIILTVKPEMYSKVDPKLLDQVPGSARVIRTRSIDCKKTFSVRGKYPRILSVPDRYVMWIPFAVAAGLRAIREHKIDLLYSTSPVASAHLIAWRLKKRTALPWVADFRDPWIEPELVPNERDLLFRIERRLQQCVLSQSDLLVFTTAGLRDYVSAQGVTTARTTVVTNGYDEADFEILPEVRPSPSPIRILHPGLLDSSYRSPRGVLIGIDSLIKQGAISPSELKLQFVGGGPYANSLEFRQMVSSLGLQDIVEVLPSVSYSESLKMQLMSHILLILQCGHDTTNLIPAKAFEYLRMRRPILAITPPGATTELFQKVGGAKIAHPDDQNAITEALRRMISSARSGDYQAEVNCTELRAYTRQNLTEQLATQFASLVK
jgi:glycosyltransferase involved in cell wall biosynthesis